MSERIPEHVAVYLRLRALLGDPAVRSRDAKRRRRAASDESSVPYGKGREPHGVGDVLGDLTSSLGWDSPLAQAELVARWAEIVGPETAAHARPEAVQEATLVVRCDSTAWAQQLRSMRAMVVTRIGADYPSAGIEAVRFIGPDTPSWKHGPRAIPGRGPRDTYG